jgi:ATP-binding cassette subfamily B (MDR/TAP) protein 1
MISILPAIVICLGYTVYLFKFRKRSSKKSEPSDVEKNDTEGGDEEQSPSYVLHASEVFTMIKTVLCFSGLKREMERFDVLAKDHLESQKKTLFVASLSQGITYGVGIWLAAISLWYSTYLKSNGEYSGDRIVIAYASMFSVILRSSSLALDVQGVLQSISAIKILANYIDVKGENDEKHQDRKMISFKHEIEFKNVSFAYPKRKDVLVLENVNLKFPKGKQIALVGLSGSGKSTILQLILRLYEPDKGSILMDGKPISQMDLNDYRKMIGYVGQEPSLFRTSIRDNILFGYPLSDLSDDQIWSALEVSNARPFIEKFPGKLDYELGSRGTSISVSYVVQL